MIKLKNIFRLEFVIVFLLLSDLFIPSVIVFEIGMNLSLIAVPVIFIFFLLKNKNFTIARSWQILFVLLLGGMVWISSLWSYTYLGVPYSSGDFLESIPLYSESPYLFDRSSIPSHPSIVCFNYTIGGGRSVWGFC